MTDYPPLYYAAACQTDFAPAQTRDDIAERTRRMCDMARNAIIGYEPFFDIRLISFPEFAHAVPIFDTPAALRERLAVTIPNEHTEAYTRLCREYGCYIQTGTFLEMDDAWPDAVFNTSVLIGPDGVLARYRKVNPWIPWEVHSSPHDFENYDEPLFPVVETEIGRIGCAICYDWLFPETIRQMAFDGADVVVRISAYMDPWGATEPMDWWTLVNRTRALENMIYVVASNQAAQMEHYPPFSWPGGSMIVDYDGRVLSQADPGPGEKVVVGPVNIAALRQERLRREGHNMRAHHRSTAYNYQSRDYLPPSADETSIESLKERIARASKKLP